MVLDISVERVALCRPVDCVLYMRILITGDRHCRCDDLGEQVLNRLLGRNDPALAIVRGVAPGVDQSFAVACRELGIAAEAHVADWKGLGNIAGPARNREMVEAGADLCIAPYRSIETSKGTKDCIRQGAGGWDSGVSCRIEVTIERSRGGYRPVTSVWCDL